MRMNNKGKSSGAFIIKLVAISVCVLLLAIVAMWFIKVGPGNMDGLFRTASISQKDTSDGDEAGNQDAESEAEVTEEVTTEEATTEEATTEDPGSQYTEDQDLALQVAQVIIEENIDTDKPLEDQLYQAYQYVIENTTYVENTPAEKGTPDWDAKSAFVTLREGAGECYGFSSAFAYLAIALGYDMEDVTVCYGVTKSQKYDWAPHGWCEIKIDGQVYLFDPEIEYKNKTCGRLFKKTYEEVARKYDKQMD